MERTHRRYNADFQPLTFPDVDDFAQSLLVANDLKGSGFAIASCAVRLVTALFRHGHFFFNDDAVTRVAARQTGPLRYHCRGVMTKRCFAVPWQVAPQPSLRL